jgi:hypothetical protein
MLSDYEDIDESLELLETVSRDTHHITPKWNPLRNYTEAEAFGRFRFHHRGIFHILNLIQDKLDTSVNSTRLGDIPPLLQLLIALRFYSNGSFQLVIGDLQGVSQPMVSKIVKRVSLAIAALRPQYIQPVTAANANLERQKFESIAGIPGKRVVIRRT